MIINADLRNVVMMKIILYLRKNRLENCHDVFVRLYG